MLRFKLIIFILLLYTGCNNWDVEVYKYPENKIVDGPIVLDTTIALKIQDSICADLEICEFYPPGQEYGGFSPKYPMLLVMNLSSFDCLKYGEGMILVCYQILIKKNNQFVLISNAEDLISVFAPVDNPEEAISFACALTHSLPLYEFDLSNKNRYFKKRLFKTHVIDVGHGYVVNLYHYNRFGCPPHELHQITYLVKRNGNIAMLSDELIYEDTENNWCVD